MAVDGYVELEALKASLELRGEVYADDDLELAIEAASRAVDNECGRSFKASTAATTRAYQPRRETRVEVDDVYEVTAITSVSHDAGDPYPWVPDQDYVMLPRNVDPAVEPYTELQLAPSSGVTGWSTGLWPTAVVSITGSFGWPAVPAVVREATSILAARFVKRVREAPFGIAGMGVDGMAVRVSRTDPDVSMLLASVIRPVRLA